MIDFQSSAIAKSASHRPCHSPSPGGDLSRLGSGERNLTEPKVAWRPSTRARASQRRDEGELIYRGRQSALTKVGRVSLPHRSLAKVGPLTAAVRADASGPSLLRASAWLPPLREQSTQFNLPRSNTNRILADTGQKMNPPPPSFLLPKCRLMYVKVG